MVVRLVYVIINTGVNVKVITEPIVDIVNIDSDLNNILTAARTCYQSFDRQTPETDERLLMHLIKSGHHAMLEFNDMTVRFTCSRGMSNELVRHRLCSFAQESTRYVNQDDPIYYLDESIQYDSEVLMNLEYITNCYKHIAKNYNKDIARQVLPIALVTEILVKANFREWLHIFRLRCSSSAHKEIRCAMSKLLKECSSRIPVIFKSLAEELL